jgi:5-methylcytosine-specific restriction enzyme subunit McrC
MRTILLREWTPKTEHLTADELAAIRTAPRYVSVQLDPETPDAYRLVPNSLVGTLVFDDLRVLIRPKVDLRNLFFLLGYGVGLTKWSEFRFPYEDEPDLLRAIALLFEREVAEAMPHGLVRGYVGREEGLMTVRGRIDLGRQIARQQGLPIPLDCRFEEYTEDVSLNRILKAAHLQLLRLRDVDPSVARRLRSWLRAFVDVEDQSFAWTEVPSHRFTRLDQHWEQAGRLAEVILRRESLADREGLVRGAAFTVDMNRLFERFIEQIVGELARAAGLQLLPQAPRRLTQSVRMKPDLVLHGLGVDLAVGDAKYKRLDIAELPHADLYQLLAYCVSLGLPRGLLIYATHEPLQVEIVRRVGIELTVTGVDLSRAPADLLVQARAAAGRLVDQALAMRAAA